MTSNAAKRGQSAEGRKEEEGTKTLAQTNNTRQCDFLRSYNQKCKSVRESFSLLTRIVSVSRLSESVKKSTRKAPHGAELE